MIVSMTGFARRKGEAVGASWVWEIRSVNGKGLDLRLRLPDWIEGLEPMVRAEAGRSLHRGNVALSLQLARGAGAAGLRVDPAGLQTALAALAEVGQAALAQGIALAPTTAAEVLCLRGVIDPGAAVDEDTTALRAALIADLVPLMADFAASREAEGLALHGVLCARIDRIAALTTHAATEAEARRPATAQALADSLARVAANAEGADAGRVAQELALMAVKSDVTEEIDRLTAHVAAARALLAETGPVGRKLDFLTQEFIREANTLCSKAQAVTLTRVGLDLKSVIDQMREQVQNVE